MTIQQELLALKNTEGLIVADDAVRWAKDNPTSALHHSLEWDDTKAAHDWRLWQVRRLISLHIVNDDGVRQVVSLKIDRTREGGGYRQLSEVMETKSLRAALLEDALAELDRVQARYKTLTELAEVWSEKDKVGGRRRRPEVAQAGAAA